MVCDRGAERRKRVGEVAAASPSDLPGGTISDLCILFIFPFR